MADKLTPPDDGHKDDTVVSRKQVEDTPDWLRRIVTTISSPEDAGDKEKTSQLKSAGVKMRGESLLSILHFVQYGTPGQQHDAGKALGYLAKLDVMTTQQKLEVKAFLTYVLTRGDLSPQTAFALLEALERVDADAFWTLVVGWWGIAKQREEE